jgi:hypothetical protein
MQCLLELATLEGLRCCRAMQTLLLHDRFGKSFFKPRATLTVAPGL